MFLIHVFAYGTLQVPDVMRTVTGAEFQGEPARLQGYARYRLVGRSFPGLRAQAGTSTAGILYRDIDAEALRRLDVFEDDFYRRETLLVIPASGVPVAAEVYVVPPEHYGLLLDQPWDLQEFQRAALPEFMGRCRGEFIRPVPASPRGE